MQTFPFNETMFDHGNSRKFVEYSINNAVEKGKPNHRPITPSRCDEKFEALPEADKLVKIWSQMTELRNDIAHVGMNLQPQAAGKLQQKAASLYPGLLEIAEKLLPPRD